jgi:hypothetical protein
LRQADPPSMEPNRLNQDAQKKTAVEL